MNQKESELLQLCDEIEASAIWEYWHPQLRPILAAARQSVRRGELLKRVQERDSYGYAIPDELRDDIVKEIGND